MEGWQTVVNANQLHIHNVIACTGMLIGQTLTSLLT